MKFLCQDKIKKPVQMSRFFLLIGNGLVTHFFKSLLLCPSYQKFRAINIKAASVPIKKQVGNFFTNQKMTSRIER